MVAVATTGGATPPGEAVGVPAAADGVEPAAGPAAGDPLDPARVTANTTTATRTAATAAAIPMRRPRPGRVTGAGDSVAAGAGDADGADGADGAGAGTAGTGMPVASGVRGATPSNT